MNQKKIKALRKALRSQGVDVNDRVYVENSPTQHVGPNGKVFAITSTVFLKQGCGRQLYKSMKG